MVLTRFFRRHSCLLLLLLTCFKSFALQDNAGLLSKWEKAKTAKGYHADTSSVKLLNQLSNQYLYNHTDSALYFAKEAQQLAREQKYTVGEAVAGLNISRSYYVKGNYILSLDAATRLMTISNQINYRPGIAGAYQLTGLIYEVENRYDDAIVSLKKALEIYTGLKDDGGIGRANFNIGLCYDEMGQHQQAFAWLDKAIQSARAANDNNLVSMTLNRTGEANFHLKNYKQALSFYQQAIDSKFSSKWEVGFALSGLAQAYYGLGDFNKAIENAQKALKTAQDVNSQSDKVRALKILAESYAAANNFKQAYTYQKQFKDESDSLFNSEKSQEINSLHLKQQRADNARLRNEIQAKEDSIVFAKRLLLFRNLIAVVVIIFIIIIVRSNRQKTSLNKVLQKRNAEILQQKAEISQQKETLHQLNRTKDQLFSVISHDLRSPFAAILQTMDNMSPGDLSPAEQKEVLNGFYQQLSHVTIMVNNLLAWAVSQQAGNKTDLLTFDLSRVIDDIVALSNFLAKNKRITLRHTFNEEKFVKADLNHVRIIFNNLIGNAIKFTPHGGTITVSYSTDEDYQIIHVADNGIGILPQKMEKLFKVTGKDISGFGTNNEAGAGIGLGLIKQFVDANNGKLEVKSRPGEGSEFVVYLERIAV